MYELAATSRTLFTVESLATQLQMDATERIQAASKFLLQSPPGEINDVLNGT